MLKNSSENTEEKSKGYRNIENGKEKVIEDINVIYHLPKGYKHIHKCLDDPKSPVRNNHAQTPMIAVYALSVYFNISHIWITL